MTSEANESHPIHSLLSPYLTVSLFSLFWFLYRHGVLHEKPCLTFASFNSLAMSPNCSCDSFINAMDTILLGGLEMVLSQFQWEFYGEFHDIKYYQFC